MVEEDAELMSSYGHTKAAITYTATLSEGPDYRTERYEEKPTLRRVRGA